MKQLTFIRHAKSDWGNEFLKDIDRPLSDRGYADAYFASNWYNDTHALPDTIISSTATRAFNTALIFARAFNFNMANFKLDETVFESSVENLLEIIRNIDNNSNSVMIFGHNPGFTNICNELTEDLFFDNVPTCGIVSLKMDINNWKDLKPKKAKIQFHQFPKDFKNND
jgi:phosphohistidine phosphatase